MPARLLDAPYQVRIVWIVAGGGGGRQAGAGGRQAEGGGRKVDAQELREHAHAS
jgi:hypothetical protein